MFITINGRLLNITDVGTARAADKTDGGEPETSVKVAFISGGYCFIPDTTVREVEQRLNEAWRAMDPF